MSTQIAELLVRNNLVTKDQLEAARAKSKENGESITYNLISLGFVEELHYVDMLSKHFGIPSADLSNIEIDISVLSLLQPEFCIKNTLIPIKRTGASLTVAIADPANLFAIDTNGSNAILVVASS